MAMDQGTGMRADIEVTPKDDAGRAAALIGLWRPLVWSAIIGGAVAALGVQIILTLMGIAAGAAVADPYSDPQARGLGVGAAIWLILSGVISFGIGGYVAGLMSGVFRTGSGALHGVLAWALAAVIGATVSVLAGAPVAGGVASATANGVTTTYERTSWPATANGNGVVSEEQARANAERAAEISSSIALWTAVAFVASLIASGVGGNLGRHSRSAFVGQYTELPPGRPAVT